MSRRNIVILVSIAVIIAATAFLSMNKFRLLVPQAISEAGVICSVVDKGTVYATVDASGIVESESEVLVLSPVSSIIKRISKVPGNRVTANQAILQLDPSPIAGEIGRIEDQLAVMRNNLHRNRLNATSTRVDLDYNVEMKKLRIASLKSELADQEELLEVGGISPARFEQTRQELTLAEKELEMTNSKNSIRLQQLEAEEEGLILGIQIQEKELEQKRLDSASTTVRAPSAGIILAVNGNEGEKVNRDQLLVRMSDLSTFKIRGSIAEENADILKIGQTVYALMDGEKLIGQVGNIQPEVHDNQVSFDVYLEQSDHSKLRPNLQIPLQVVQRMRQDVLRLESGPALEKGRNVEVYVVEGNRAVLRKVTLGMKGQGYIEVRGGVDSGEKVIISDISSFRNLPEVEFMYN